jgi:hypothetical protein
MQLAGCSDAPASRPQLTMPIPQLPRPSWESLVVESTGDAAVAYARPDERSRHRIIQPARLDTGPQTFLVLGQRPGWIRVQLPVRPNGSSAWLRSEDVRLLRNEYQVRVDLARRELVARERGRVFLRTPVAIGAAASPTPPGRWYVTYGVRLRDPDNVYGPFAIGLSAHSPTLESFNGQDAQIALHGTNDPGSIGHAVSNGCVRLPNAQIRRLVARLPRGTPVVIR